MLPHLSSNYLFPTPSASQAKTPNSFYHPLWWFPPPYHLSPCIVWSEGFPDILNYPLISNQLVKLDLFLWTYSLHLPNSAVVPSIENTLLASLHVEIHCNHLMAQFEYQSFPWNLSYPMSFNLYISIFTFILYLLNSQLLRFQVSNDKETCILVSVPD